MIDNVPNCPEVRLIYPDLPATPSKQRLGGWKSLSNSKLPNFRTKTISASPA